MFPVVFFFFNQKTAYGMRISDWSSDVCSADLPVARAGAEPVERGEADLAVLGQPDGRLAEQAEQAHEIGEGAAAADIITDHHQIGRASCRERECQYV